MDVFEFKAWLRADKERWGRVRDDLPYIISQSGELDDEEVMDYIVFSYEDEPGLRITPGVGEAIAWFENVRSKQTIKYPSCYGLPKGATYADYLAHAIDPDGSPRFSPKEAQYQKAKLIMEYGRDLAWTDGHDDPRPLVGRLDIFARLGIV